MVDYSQMIDPLIKRLMQEKGVETSDQAGYEYFKEKIINNINENVLNHVPENALEELANISNEADHEKIATFLKEHVENIDDVVHNAITNFQI